MTDNEIIKALECCSANDCNNCPYDKHKVCGVELSKDALDFINRQQTQIEKLENIEHASEKLIKKQEAEIERLKAEAQMADGYEDALVEMTKSEAIKEFAEKLKNLTKYYWLDEINIDHIDNLVKEMTE